MLDPTTAFLGFVFLTGMFWGFALSLLWGAYAGWWQRHMDRGGPR